MKELTYLVSPSERGILDNAGDRPPLGLLYVADAIERADNPVRVYDLNHTSEKKLLQDICKEDPDTVGVSCLTSPMAKESKRLLKEIRTITDERLIVGGYHPTIMPEDFADYVDYIKVGNIPNLDKPARHLLDMKKYNMDMDGLRTATMITSIGCPNNCTFCGNTNHKVSYQSLEAIAEDLNTIKKDGYQAVYILDDVFTLNKERAMKIAEMIGDRNLYFRCTTRANYMDSELAKHFSENNCHMVSLGVESGNDKILQNIGKNQQKSDITKAVNYLGQNGITTKGFFILGLPGETRKTAQQTIDYSQELRKLGMSKADFYPLVPYPGTEIYYNPNKHGIIIDNKDYDSYLQTAEPVCHTKDLSRADISNYLMKAKELWTN